MITYAEAEKLVQAQLDERTEITQCPMAILHEHTIAKPYGWVFFYQSRAFVEGKNKNDRLSGNHPFLVDRLDASIVPLGRFQEELAEYEAKLSPERLAEEPEPPRRKTT